MDIVIISEFGEDYSITDNDRFLYLAKMLANDNKVEIITSSFWHTKKKHRRKSADKWPFKITFIEEPGYSKNICLKRFFSHFIFGINLIKYIKNRNEKPDVIYCAVPSLFGPNLVSKYCNKNNIRFIIDVQDIWPEAFQMVFDVPIVSDVIFLPIKIIANGVYRRADSICAVSDTYCKRALSVNKKCRKTTTVFLGTELDQFDLYSIQKPIMYRPEGEIWIAYCGTLGASYDLTCVIDAIKMVDYNVRLIVMGDGPQFNEFKDYAQKKGILCSFTGRLPYDSMCSLLNQCNITINPISHKAAQSIINKHADYAASGLPVISTQESLEYINLIKSYKMGYSCRNNDSKRVAECIIKLIENEKIRKQKGLNARKCAEELFDRKRTYKLLYNQIISK